MINPPSSANNDSANAAPTPGRGRKWLTYSLLGLLLALGLLTALIPTILSTTLGKGVAVGVINDTVRGSVTIDALSLSWLSGQNIRGVEILDATGERVVRLEELSTELTLLKAIQRKLSLGRTKIRGLTAEIIVDESGTNNLAQALEPNTPSTTDATPILIPLTGNIELSDAHITVTPSNAEPVVFEGLTGTVRVAPTARTLDVALQGRSRQGLQTGEFNITGQVEGMIAPDGALTPQTATGNLEANVKALPIDGVDGMLGLKGLLRAGVGNRANLKMQASGTAQMQNVIVAADSPNIQAGITAEINQGRFALTQPASIRLVVTPDFFQELTASAENEAALHLVEAFPLNLKAERLDLSVSDFNLGDIALRGGVEAEKPIALSGARELGDVTLRGLNATLDSERLSETVGIKLGGEALTQGKPGQIEVQAKLDQLINQQGTLQLDKLRADVEANLSNVPTLLIDQLARQNGQLVSLLGSKVDLSARIKSSGPDQIDGTLSVDAGPLKAEDITLSITDSIVLAKPANIRYLISPEVVRKTWGEDPGFALRQPTALVLEIRDFSAPRPTAGEPMFQPAKIKLQASLVSDQLELSDIPNFDTLRVADARLDLKADSLSSIRLSGSALVSEAKKGMLAELNASPLQVSIDTTTGLDDKGQIGLIAAQLQLSSEGMNGKVDLSIPSDFSRAALTAPASLQLAVTPGLVQRLGASQPTLGKPVPVEIRLSRLDLPLAAFSLAELQAEAAVRIEELILAGDKSVAGTALRNADIAFDYRGPDASATVKLAAETVLPGEQKAGALKLDATLSRLLRNGELSLSTADVNAKANIDSLPTALIEAFSGQAAVVPIVGDFMQVDAAVELSSDKGVGTIELKTQSPNLSADAGLKIGDELVLSRPANMRLTLTPSGYAALAGMSSASSDKGESPSGYELTEDATFDAVVTQLRWPFPAANGKTQFNPSRAAVAATLTAPRISLRDRISGDTLSIEMLETMLQGDDLSKPIGFKLSGQIRGPQSDQAQPGDPSGRLAISGQAADVFAADGQLNSDGLSISMDGQLQKLPAALLDQILDMDGLVVATLGDAADLTLNANVRQMVGPLNLQLRSAKANVDINAELRSEGLVLTEPLVAEVEVTQTFGQLVLGKIHPIFETAQSADQAVRFEVPQKGVLIPIRDYDINNIVIPLMKLDLGTLTLKSGWLLKGAIGLAQQFGALKGSGRDQWTAQFTPAILQMGGGVVTYERRLDLLLDERMHLATWGTADIANDSANLILAFMPETLEKIFGLTVAPGDALRIPVRGALSEPSVDFAKAGLELERLRTQKRLAKKDKLVGALVGAVAATAIGGAPMPPASVEPLPWGPLPVPEGQVDAQQTEEPAQSTEPTPPKSIEQQAIEGLMGILKKKKE